MAYKISPNSLIRCSQCGEDYSATYRRCPFCGTRNTPPPAPSFDPEDELDRPSTSARPSAPVDPDDTYVFSGQDLFDDDNAEEDYAPARSRGGKRLAEKPLANPFANADINWPRMITFVCSLIIIVAAMVIVFTVVYPQLRGNNPTAENNSPSSAVTDPGAAASDPDTVVTGPNTAASEPGTDTSPDVPPAGADRLTTLAFKGPTDNDFTLQPGGSHTITLNFAPADWSGSVTWTSSNTAYATVDANGKVTNVNSTDQLRTVIITVSAGGLSLESKVYCRGVTASQPPVTQAPASDPPTTQAPSGGNRGTVDATGGLNVRSGPGTTYDKIASLSNGTTVTILENAGNGWYKISFTGAGGAAKEGYVLGEYISTN